ncbi:uncharacterized protein LOC116256973 [Nymphaea colorata]|nr:uncharacterized protein LOC116256973 [Nymphaea colorata]
MEATNEAGKHPNGLEDEGVKEDAISKPTEDARMATTSSSSFCSSADGDDFFQLETSTLEEAATSLGGERIECMESCRVETDKIEVKTLKQSREDEDELSAPTQTEDRPNEKPCISGSISSDFSVGGNSDDRTSAKSMSDCSREFVIDENIDVNADMTFKSNHSALDYSHVSQSENYSTYLGFAKQSLASYGNEKPDAYDPMRIPASIFSKPQSTMEWSVASNDSSYNVQGKRVDAQQKPPVILAIPRANSMPRHSDASVRSFAFPILTADGHNASRKVEEESQAVPQVDQEKPGLPPRAWFSCLFCC